MNAEAAMRLALAQARRSSGRTAPNPPVGAIVYRGDRILGRGCTQPVGGAHAEVVALDRALAKHGARSVRGASLAVTLEPCFHEGRTGPCVARVLDAGIGRVALGHRDPNPRVSGRSVRRLRRAGIEVESGVLEAECREQHRGFLRELELGRPFVALKLASTLDGRIATRSGESRWITGPDARKLVHRLRARVDAVVVGSGTVRADDPQLFARRGDAIVHRPVRVLLDTRLRVPAGVRLFREDADRTWVLCARSAPAARRRALERQGVRVLSVALRGKRLDLARACERLAQEGLRDVLVEGGGVLAAGLLGASLVDELHWFVAPRWIGADGRPALGAMGIDALARAGTLRGVEVRRVGKDIHVRGRVGAEGQER
jgi:diaminohydroxyphosphoribosylaminopyrimidine deaminase/5-amino-6-(5-phosphoribosylamino)uracil reductase